MTARIKTALLSAIGICIALLAAAACQDSPVSDKGGEPAQQAQVKPNASVTGSVTYRERLALTSGATLKVQLRDVSYQDAASELIAEQVIHDPGQAPIKFRVKYNRDDLVSRNTYAIQADIIESDGRLAFTNDISYEVVTRGNPNKVDMVLVMVEPPPLTPDGSGEGDDIAVDSRKWVEVEVPVVEAEVLREGSEYFLLATYLQSGVDGCVRPGGQKYARDGTDITVTITLMQPPPTPWAIPCSDSMLELETVVPIGGPFTPGQTYRVEVNGQETNTFTFPDLEFPDSFITESKVESVEVLTLESLPPHYELRVVFGFPKGSGCSRFNGYKIRRSDPTRIDVAITHHEVADPFVACTADYPISEVAVPLGSGFDSGLEYTVNVNSDATETFIAR